MKKDLTMKELNLASASWLDAAEKYRAMLAEIRYALLNNNLTGGQRMARALVIIENELDGDARKGE